MSLHPAAQQAIKDFEDATKAENDLRNLVGLANHPGFSMVLSWLRKYDEALAGICCSVKTDEKDAMIARAELRVVRGLLAMFDGAQEALPHAVKFLSHLQATAAWWQTLGIDITQRTP